MTEEELARELGSVEAESATAEVPEDDCTYIQNRLRHVHLPKLDDLGLVEWNRTRGTVQMADHPVVDSPRFEQLLDADEESDQLIACLADECRRTILDVLESNGEDLSFEELARTVSHHMERRSEPGCDVRIQLHHVHLPRLDEAGLVDYHGPDGQVELNPNRPRFTIENV